MDNLSAVASDTLMCELAFYSAVVSVVQCNVSTVTVTCKTMQKARSSVYCVKLTVTAMLELTLAGLADCAEQMRAAAATGKAWSPMVE